LGQPHSNLGGGRNVSINWKNLSKFEQTKSTLTKQQQLHSNLGQVEHLHSIFG